MFEFHAKLAFKATFGNPWCALTHASI